MKNIIENKAGQLMIEAGFSVHGIIWAMQNNSETWAYYLTLAANKEAVCV